MALYLIFVLRTVLSKFRYFICTNFPGLCQIVDLTIDKPSGPFYNEMLNHYPFIASRKNLQNEHV